MCGGDLPVDRILRDGETFELGDRRLEVVLTRGHTPRATARSSSGRRACSSAATRFRATASVTSSGTSVFAPLYDDVDDYLEGLERLRALPFAQLCPAPTSRRSIARTGSR